ncbi:hypothetical protein ACFY78_17275 [Streptomyces olindensis]|uniref:hypothetical protein n=1 Tax=Streptomyces olindensis TaxID=358823 RepID=UPI0036C8C172
MRHRSLRVGSRDVLLHVHPVELLRNVDVIVSPTHTLLALPALYQAWPSAAPWPPTRRPRRNGVPAPYRTRTAPRPQRRGA